ncbi:SIMPL domain-containing protein [Aminipila terrae]|uniref:DUF541 domain-containing protein n=1 Tax=Aminipila terrae TaxID=2697030 RepID=A0A6P1MCA9_9FIRM|nr:SIMPL domain-containing protein [Aminipila terrae]QHI71662.1 DUF541 domain-containing protein [Aminipila terrae]
MAHSRSVNPDPGYTMTLTGQGLITAPPDLAVIRLGVQTTGTNVSQIQSENAQIIQNIVQALSQFESAEMKTIEYSIDRLYEYQNGNPIDKGYQVKHILEIKTGNIDEAGKIIDTAVEMGANIVDSIFFVLADSELFYQQALNLAVDNAIQKSRSVSANIHIKLNPVPIRIIENSISPAAIPLLPRQIVSTPVISGELTIQAFITADFVYSE